MLRIQMMAQGFAERIGASKRQVQHWTDRGVLHCIPETDNLGRGRQRLYNKEELPVAAIIAAASKYQLPIGMLTLLSKAIRMLAYGPPEVSRRQRKSWYQSALRGERKTYIAIRACEWSPAVTNPVEFIDWVGEKKIRDMVSSEADMLLLPVKKIVDV